MTNRWVPVCALLALGLVRPAAGGSTEEWLRWRLEHEQQRLLEELGEEPDPLALAVTAGWLWDGRELEEPRSTVIRIGTAPAPPRLALRAGLAGGERSEAVVGLVVSMQSRPVYRASGPQHIGAHEPLEQVRHPDVLAELLRGEPDILEVHAAAIRHAGCTEESMRALERDARGFGALPEVSVRGGLDGGWDRDLDPFGNATGMGDEQAWDLQLELEWDLADLAMSYERIRVQAEHQDLVKHRAALLDAVTAAYFERQHLRAALSREEPDRTAAEQLTLALSLAEVTARLDGLTGGAFSEMVAEELISIDTLD